MAVHSATTVATLDWSRIAATGTTIAAHAIAVLLLAMPLAPAVRRALPAITEVTLREVAPPPPAIPQPPEPVVPPRHLPPVHAPTTIVPKPTPVAAPVTSIPTPEAPPTTPAQTDSAPTELGPSSTATTSSGPTRTLAYDGALKLRYPPASIRAHEQGTVLLRVLVDAQGAAQRIEIARSSGHPQLDSAAREAVERAHFRPVLQNGEAVPAWGLVPIEFRLDRA